MSIMVTEGQRSWAAIVRLLCAEDGRLEIRRNTCVGMCNHQYFDDE